MKNRILRRLVLSGALLGALLSICLVLGAELRAYGGLGLSPLRRAGRMLLVFLLLSPLACAALGLAARPAPPAHDARPLRFIPLFLFFLACYTPALLAYCPGIVAYDATAQILQGVDGAYSTHHPLLHTLLLSLCVRLGGVLHSYTLGAGLYTLLQMTLLSSLFAACVRQLAALGASRRACLAAAAFYGLYPVHAIMAISTTKDTLFAGLAALTLLRTIALLRSGRASFQRPARLAAYVCLCALTCLFRNNGVYALAFMGLLCVLWHRGLRLRLTALFAACLIAYAGANAALVSALHAAPGSSLEMLCVPIQQMARVARYHSGELAPEASGALAAYMPLGEENPYAPHLADPVKMRMDKDAFSRDPRAFAQLYLRLGAAYPQEYLNAALLLNQGVWDPLDTSTGHIYDMWEAGQHGYLQTRFQRRIDDTRGIRIEQKSLLPRVQRWYERICTDNVLQRHPITNLLFSPASAWWVCCFALVLFLMQRRYACAAPVGLLAGLFLTQLLGPCSLVRYAYPFFVCAPLFLALMRSREAAR